MFQVPPKPEHSFVLVQPLKKPPWLLWSAQSCWSRSVLYRAFQPARVSRPTATELRRHKGRKRPLFADASRRKEASCHFPESNWHHETPPHRAIPTRAESPCHRLGHLSLNCKYWHPRKRNGCAQAAVRGCTTCSRRLRSPCRAQRGALETTQGQAHRHFRSPGRAG